MSEKVNQNPGLGVGDLGPIPSSVYWLRDFRQESLPHLWASGSPSIKWGHG